MNEAYRDVIAAIESVPPEALILAMFVAGAALLFFGWHLYRIALVTSGVLIGGAIGTLIAIGLRIAFEVKIPALVLAIPIGIALGLLANKMQKIGAFFIGGLCLAIPILDAPSLIEIGHAVWIAAGIAFILGGVLAVLFWRPMIIVSLAVLGAKLIALGTFGIFDHFGRFDLRASAQNHPYVAAAAMGVLTLLGVLFQMRGNGTSDTSAPKESGKNNN